MKKFLLKLLMGASLTTSVFIFQACYGTPVPPPDGVAGSELNQTELQEVVQEEEDAATTTITEEIPD
ncbi:MAG: hypothetical protein J5886_02245 [Bacteroidales bacterium]|nr:hypothetical protein [Bacteroidales bacterium]